jgi:hypothetical protein
MVRLARAVQQTTARQDTELVVVVDDDDLELPNYVDALARHTPWITFRVMHQPRKIGPILNFIALELAPQYDHLGFMGDDHLPQTPEWDKKLVTSLGGRPGVAYGDDLFQRENLPTACVMSSDLVQVLRYMCPPGLLHLFLDDFWRELGHSVGNLRYCPDVVIEHLHPVAGKAPHDAGYAWSLDSGLMTADGNRYREFLDSQWQQDRDNLRKKLGL